MVYNKIVLYYGSILDEKQLVEFANKLDELCGNVNNTIIDECKRRCLADKDYYETSYHYDLLELINNFLNSRFYNMEVTTFPCCSELHNVKFIVGRAIKEIKRLNVECSECASFRGACINCDTCFGATENGFYDTTKIHNELVTVKDHCVCKWCFYDKCDSHLACPRCHHETFKNSTVNTNKSLIFDTKFVDLLPNKVFVYNLDDCVSCS
jgi:hypothetical protein